MDEITIDLKSELDRIDSEGYEYALNGYLDSRLRILIGMWEKGEAIISFLGGVKKKPNFLKLEQVTGRSDSALKQWHDLYKKYPNKEDYIEQEAKPKAISWAQKALEEKEKDEKDEDIQKRGFKEEKDFFYETSKLLTRAFDRIQFIAQGDRVPETLSDFSMMDAINHDLYRIVRLAGECGINIQTIWEKMAAKHGKKIEIPEYLRNPNKKYINGRIDNIEDIEDIQIITEK